MTPFFSIINQNRSLIKRVKELFEEYKKAKKQAKPFRGVVTQREARYVLSRTQQEMAVLEGNIAQFKAVSRRVRPSVNNEIPKQLQRDITSAIKMATEYRDDYERIYKAWKKYSQGSGRASVKLPLYPAPSIENEKRSNTNHRGIRFSKAVNKYMDLILGWYENSRYENLPILPNKRSSKNVRHMTIANAKKVRVSNPANLKELRDLRNKVKRIQSNIGTKNKTILRMLRNINDDRNFTGTTLTKITEQKIQLERENQLLKRYIENLEMEMKIMERYVPNNIKKLYI